MLVDLEKDLNFRTKVFCISTYKNNLTEGITDIYKQLQEKLSDKSLKKNAIIKQVFFIEAYDNSSFEQTKNNLFSNSIAFFQVNIPTTVVPQPPLGSSKIVAEFMILENSENYMFEYKSIGNNSYLNLISENLNLLISSGLHKSSLNTNIYEQSLASFEMAKTILNNEKMDFSNVVRQWNYIENIVFQNSNGQHYQIFNDIRTKFYDECQFTYGYPAATGIGMETGGIIIDFIALKTAKNTEIIAFKSPVQSDAHRYSKNVLSNAAIALEKLKTTPKFERAKAITVNKKGLFFISGTAAIKGESSAANLGAREQTLMTLENIFSLASTENLKYHHLYGKCHISAIRVYVKRKEDIKDVAKIIAENVINISYVIVKADICRPELLVEIEGIAEILPD